MNQCEEFATSGRVFIIAPAGCGKTELIAAAVTRYSGGRDLVLTHTHAGIDALRRRLKQMGAASTGFHIDTIAGWALRYAAAFPSKSGLVAVKPTSTGWNNVYAAAANLLLSPPIQRIVRATYTGVYVDEYQDCTVEQHRLLLRLAELLPCRIVGDHLQGIFDFKDNILVDWDLDVASNFRRLADLSIPWRWKDTSPELGTWLTEHVRRCIGSGEPIDISKAPRGAVRWVKLPTEAGKRFEIQVNACRRAPPLPESTIAIQQWEPQCQKLANRLAPAFFNIETIECKDLLNGTDAIERNSGMERVEIVLQFASKCLTGVKSSMSTVLLAVKRDRVQNNRTYTRQEQLEALLCLRDASDMSAVLPALESLRRIPGTKLWRRELFFAMCQSLREFATGQHDTLTDAAWTVRDRTRHMGRCLGTRAIGRTLLVKRLEFHHCIILDGDSLKAKDLYVALTRASKSLTILSTSQTLNQDQHQKTGSGWLPGFQD